MGTTTATCWESVDAAVAAGAETAFALLERLVAEPSTVGREHGAQELAAGEFDAVGLGVNCLEIPAETAAGAPGGVAQAPYQGRPNVLGRINPGMSPSLLLNGHIDVVPAEAADRAVNPVRFIPLILRALAGFEAKPAAADGPAFGEVARPYNVNVGTVTAGDWASSVPARATLGVRVGFPRSWTPERALRQVRAAVLHAAAADPWLAATRR